MPTHATALFGDRHAAHAAVEQLVQAGFTRDAISVLMSESTLEREFGVTGPDSEESSGVRSARPTGILGAIVAGLVVLAPPCGLSLRAAGPLLSMLLREAPQQGGFSEALTGAGLAGDHARFVDAGVRDGAIVVGVHASDERARLAMQLLELSGGASLQAA